VRLVEKADAIARGYGSSSTCHHPPPTSAFLAALGGSLAGLRRNRKGLRRRIKAQL
jgi:hypothetical protein